VCAGLVLPRLTTPSQTSAFFVLKSSFFFVMNAKSPGDRRRWLRPLHQQNHGPAHRRIWQCEQGRIRTRTRPPFPLSPSRLAGLIAQPAPMSPSRALPATGHAAGVQGCELRARPAAGAARPHMRERRWQHGLHGRALRRVPATWRQGAGRGACRGLPQSHRVCSSPRARSCALPVPGGRSDTRNVCRRRGGAHGRKRDAGMPLCPRASSASACAR